MKIKSSFFTGLFLGLIAAITLWVLLVAGQLGQPHKTNLWVEQAYSKKIAATKNLGEVQKILIVAGSGAMFGIDSTAISKAWNMPVVNLGVNAGLGPNFIIDYAQPLVGRGDVVIAPLEYPLYSFNGEINHVFLSYLLSHPALMRQLSIGSLTHALGVLPLQRVLEGYQGLPENFHTAAGLYGPHNLDEQGDQINSELANRDSLSHQAMLESKAETYGKGLKLDALGWRLWSEFADRLEKTGACIIFVPPPMMFKSEYLNLVEENFFYTQLPQIARSKGLNYRGNPVDFLYPEDWFFDTNYHLVAEKRKRYTRALVSLIGDDPVKKCAAYMRLKSGK